MNDVNAKKVSIQLTEDGKRVMRLSDLLVAVAGTIVAAAVAYLVTQEGSHLSEPVAFTLL